MSDDVRTKVYCALCNDNDEEVIELCSLTEERSLLICTLHNSTVLSMACYFENFDLANELFDNLGDHNHHSLLTKGANTWGDTVLHDTSTSDHGVELAKKLLKKVPELLPVRNKWGESCVFQAIRYGNKQMFEFLSVEVDKYCDLHKEFENLYFFQNYDNTTILHLAILTRNIDMALMIAKKYPNLCGTSCEPDDCSSDACMQSNSIQKWN